MSERVAVAVIPPKQEGLPADILTAENMHKFSRWSLVMAAQVAQVRGNVIDRVLI